MPREYKLNSPGASAPGKPPYKPKTPYVELTDESPMPFGKHKGKPMKTVDVSYLKWLWNNGVSQQPRTPIHQYIKRAMKALEMEDPDAIFDQSE